MKQLVLVGTLVSALGAAPVFAQGRAGGAANPQGGHTAPKAQPDTAPAPTIPTGEMALGTVRIPKAVKVDGKTLPAGSYQVKLTAQAASPAAAGQTPNSERFVELVQGGQVKARDVMTIVPQSEIDKVQKDTPPPRNGSKVEVLRGGDYVRVWINRGGNHYLLYLPVTA